MELAVRPGDSVRSYQNSAVEEPPGTGIPLDQPGDDVCIRQGSNLAQPLGAGSGDALGPRGDLSRDTIEIVGDVPSIRRELDDGHPRAPRFRQGANTVQPMELPWIPEVRVERHRAVGIRPAVSDEIFGAVGEGALVAGGSGIDPSPND